MRVVLDTNVIISGIFVPNGPPGMIVDFWAKGKLTVVISQSLLEEYLEVLLRPKFNKVGTINERQGILEQFLDLENTVLVSPDFQLNVIENDPDDNRVLECALEGGVQYIVSGDEHLLALKEFQGIIIVSPAEFVKPCV
ncbi:putative PIN family toxin of toxin-antitoxin system [Desulfofundulus luciae]|uniref:PIN family toxin of toxin-antitoxin system n=1 Tax=Desulfofundulus luciae TaxID=74702 RepID=A0ABU0AYP6_9FIRM|nr:putative toxin-antitoxin system toxin component, PIN family [Desulfofundulus luciae]MDQ0285599.1 putative PIN family toxin of toxin-antitoxin system [Desulfofundulus luciae]